MRRYLALSVGLVLLMLTGCEEKGTLDRTQVEFVTVNGRRFEVRIAPTGKPDEYAMLIIRATMVVNPDPENETSRAREVAGRYMDQTCKSRPHQEIVSGLQGSINYRVLFRCT